MSMMHSSESKRAPGIVERIRLASGSRFSLYVLVCLHIIICCTSLAQVAHWQSYMLYDAARLYYAACQFDAVAVGNAFKDAVFLSYNGPDARFALPRLPTMYLYSYRRKHTEKPWFM